MTNQSTQEIGYATKSNNYLVYIEGLPSVRINSIIQHESGSSAIVSGLDNKNIRALMLDSTIPLPGDSFAFSSSSITLPVGEKLIGRVIDPLGKALDGNDERISKDAEKITVLSDSDVLGISRRHMIDKQFVTGLSTIDTLFPIGQGQRELIVGEPRSGKTPFLYDIIANQRDTNIICVYCSIGQSELEIKGFASNIQEVDAQKYTIIVAAASSNPAPLISIAPITAISIAEYFRDQGKNVLLILDDMGLHAKYVREIALLSEIIPGRESYPGNIFYNHARIVERAGNFISEDGKSISAITLFPIIDTISESITSYITTNLMSMTDGHLLFSADLKAAGQYPAIDIPRSVTRVGSQTQHTILRALSDKIRILLSQYDHVKTYSKFGSELTGNTVNLINQSEIILDLLRQEDRHVRDIPTQIIFLSLPFTRLFAQRNVVFAHKYKQVILSTIQTDNAFITIRKALSEITFDQLLDKINNSLDVLNKVCQ